MKKWAEILKQKELKILDKYTNGYFGTLYLKETSTQALFIAKVDCIEHVGIYVTDCSAKSLSWEDICRIKNIFWNDVEKVLRFDLRNCENIPEFMGAVKYSLHLSREGLPVFSDRNSDGLPPSCRAFGRTATLCPR